MSEQRPNKAQRRADAKQRREAEMRRRGRAQAMRKVRLSLLAALVIGAVVGLVLFNSARGRQGRQRLTTLAATAGCSSLQSPSDQGASPHLGENETFQYNTDPPTSGHHDGSWAQTGIHSEPVPDRNQVHNLEHGHVGIQFSGETTPLIDKLATVVRSNPTRVFLAPRPEMKTKLAFTSWGHLITCDKPNDEAVKLAKEWVKQFAGKGAEGDIPSQNTVGV